MVFLCGIKHLLASLYIDDGDYDCGQYNYINKNMIHKIKVNIFQVFQVYRQNDEIYLFILKFKF